MRQQRFLTGCFALLLTLSAAMVLLPACSSTKEADSGWSDSEIGDRAGDLVLLGGKQIEVSRLFLYRDSLVYLSQSTGKAYVCPRDSVGWYSIPDPGPTVGRSAGIIVLCTIVGSVAAGKAAPHGYMSEGVAYAGGGVMGLAAGLTIGLVSGYLMPIEEVYEFTPGAWAARFDPPPPPPPPPPEPPPPPPPPLPAYIIIEVASILGESEDEILIPWQHGGAWLPRNAIVVERKDASTRIRMPRALYEEKLARAR